jgi:uncharacterized protein YjbJ (UPF0337 family)
MRQRKENPWMNVLMGAGLYLLDTARDRWADQAAEVRSRAREGYDNLRDKAKDTYETASDRVSRASDALRGEDHSGIKTAAALLVGVAVGVGIGLLFAPASGEEVRENLAGKVQDFGGRVKSRFSKEGEAGSGTYGA